MRIRSLAQMYLLGVNHLNFLIKRFIIYEIENERTVLLLRKELKREESITPLPPQP